MEILTTAAQVRSGVLVDLGRRGRPSKEAALWAAARPVAPKTLGHGRGDVSPSQAI